MKRPLWITLLLAALAASGCATIPPGPSVMVMPGHNKSFEVFQADDFTCREWAQTQAGWQANETVNQNLAGGAVAGGLLGAAAGALIGAASGDAGPGAAIGFQIEQNDQGQVKQYRSQLAVLDGDRELLRQEISVNHPLRFAGYNVYQASYLTDPTRATSLALVVRPRLEEDATAHAHGHAAPSAPGAGSPLQATMDTSFPVPGQDGYELRVRRFFAHLQITDAGPVNASRDLVNPAAEIEILRGGVALGTQWAFMRFPPHARTDIPFVVELHDVRPAMATGLEVNTNPGAPLVWLGFLLATRGLVFTFLVR